MLHLIEWYDQIKGKWLCLPLAEQRLVFRDSTMSSVPPKNESLFSIPRGHSPCPMLGMGIEVERRYISLQVRSDVESLDVGQPLITIVGDLIVNIGNSIESLLPQFSSCYLSDSQSAS